LRGGPRDIHVIYGALGATWKFKALQSANSDIKDICCLLNGQLLVLERTRDATGKNSEAHLRLVDMARCTTGSLCGVTEVAVSNPAMLHKEFEGLTRVADDLYLLVSDEPATNTGGGQLLLFRLTR